MENDRKVNNQKEYFEMLTKVINSPIYTTRNFLNGDKYTPGFRKPLGQIIPPIDHRTVGANEIIFELDFPSFKQNVKYAHKIIETLIYKQIPYTTFASGGKGIHIHVFFDVIINNEECKKLFEEAIEKGFQYKHIRFAFLKEVLIEAELYNLDVVGMGKRIDTSPIEFDDYESSGKLIRVCGGRKMYYDSVMKETEKIHYKSMMMPEEITENYKFIKR